MREVRDLAARMLAGTEPPLRPADEMLGIARRVRRRQAWLVSAGAGGLALVIVLGVVALVRPLTQPVPGPDAVAAPSAPVARAAASHGQRMADLLLAAVPDGYTSGPPDTFSTSVAVHSAGPDDRPRVLAATVIRLFAGAGEGQLFAYIVHDGRMAPPDDLCAIDDGGRRSGCETGVVGGVPIRLVTMTDPHGMRKIEATRFLAGGRLIVGVWQATPADPAALPAELRAPSSPVVWLRPPLTDLPLDAAALAALAADPAMLPS